MSIKRFELWLDESGDFENDSNINKNPSLVGGILTEKGKLNTSMVLSILDQEYVHSNEINKKYFGAYAIKVLSDVVQNYGDLVIFENQERLEIVDGNITYLNVISEGIIQLLQLLAAQYGYIELDVLVAVRLDMQKQDLRPGQIIKQEEYILRLQERIIVGLARRTLSNNKNWSWNVQMASARKDPRLMLADVLCNSFLTKNSKKFNDEQRKQLISLFNQKYLFTIFEKATTRYIKRLIVEGAIGEAIFEIYASEEKLNKKEPITIILNRIHMLDDEGIRAQLLNIKIRVGSLIRIDKDYKKSKKVLLNIQEEFIPLMIEKNIEMGIFSLDIYLYLLTIYTHEGNVVRAEQQINLCKTEIKKLKNRWESIDYFFMLKIRQAVHQINTFDYIEAIQNMNGLIKTLEETMSIFPLAHDLEELYSEIKSDLIGKALGTRLQARRFMIRKDPHQVQEARKDSNRAMLEFMNDSDTIRQYQYRCEIETEGGNYLAAINYLCKSLGLLYKSEDTMVILLNSIMNNQKSVQLYSLMHYLRIMAETAISGDDKISSSMFEAWNKVKVGNSNIILEPSQDHPYEIILWKLGTYMGKTGSITAAIKYYDRAIHICNSIPERITLRAIGLGIMAEKASMLALTGDQRFNAAEKDFINTYQQFIKNEIPKSMFIFFQEWKGELKNIKETDDYSQKAHFLWKLSRKISH